MTPDKTRREHLRYLIKGGEVYEETAPTLLPWGDPDWLTSREHAWISPTGEYHKLEPNDHHLYWANRRGDDFKPMLDRHWIRKADRAIYQVGHKSDFPRVLAHVDETHPEVKRISITHPLDFSGLTTSTRFNKVGEKWQPEKVAEAAEEPVRVSRPDEVRAIAKRAKLDIGRFDIKQLLMGMKAEREHDKPGDTDIIKGSSTARAEKLLKVALAHVRERGDYYTRLKKVEEGAGRGGYLGTRDAGWIAPDDTYHQLPKGTVHDYWIRDNGPLLASTGVKPDAFGYDKRAIIGAGWIQKHAANVYSAHDKSAVPRVVKHFTERHPEVKRVMVSFKTGGNVYVTRDGTVKEPIPFRAEEQVQENWMRTREAAWVAPDDTVHPLRQRQFHVHWVTDNAQYHAPELVQRHDGGIDAFETENAMLKHGWFKKQDKDMYHADASSLGRVHKHFTTHHPELDSVHVSGAGRLGTTLRLFRDGRSEKLVYGVNENWMHTRSAAWIDPGDNVHPLVGGQFHTDWVRANSHRIPAAHKSFYGHDDRDGLDAYATSDKMLAAGWIRKQDDTVYNTGNLNLTRERIIKHVKQHHPGVRRVRVNEPSKDSWLDIPDGDFNEAWRGGPLDRWLATRTAGWIAPDHTCHQLNPGEHHREWSTNPRNARHLRDVLGVIDPTRHWDANVVQHEMMKQGWIRKLDHDQYLVGRRSMIAQALRHHERFHPHKNRVEVAVENYPAQGMLHRFYFQRDPNTREILPRRDWRERRRLRKSQQDRKWGSSS